MIRILFVDDERDVLDGLRRSLRRRRDEWEMHFVESGVEAIEAMQSQPFDVLVTDMRMPGMDGGSLLVEVQKRWPAIVRFVLSGYAESEAIMRTIPVAHQFIAKPADSRTIQAAIERAMQLQRVVRDKDIAGWLGGLDTLPSLPSTYSEILASIRDPEVSIAALARQVERDAGLTAKILQLVNSAFFGVSCEVMSVGQAIGLLGTGQLRDIALTAEAFRPAADMPPRLIELMRSLETRSLRTAAIASRIQPDAKLRDLTFSAGLLHDVGVRIFAARAPAAYLDLLHESRSTGRAMHLLEKERHGVEHGELGAVLLAYWGLPYPIVEAAAFHNEPRSCVHGPTSPATMVYVADALSNGGSDREEARDARGLDMDLLEALGLTERLEEWIAVVEEVDELGA